LHAEWHARLASGAGRHGRLHTAALLLRHAGRHTLRRGLAGVLPAGLRHMRLRRILRSPPLHGGRMHTLLLRRGHALVRLLRERRRHPGLGGLEGGLHSHG
jgi:hypothetical protein